MDIEEFAESYIRTMKNVNKALKGLRMRIEALEAKAPTAKETE